MLLSAKTPEVTLPFGTPGCTCRSGLLGSSGSAACRDAVTSETIISRRLRGMGVDQSGCECQFQSFRSIRLHVITPELAEVAVIESTVSDDGIGPGLRTSAVGLSRKGELSLHAVAFRCRFD